VKGASYVVSDVGESWDGPFVNVEGVKLPDRFFGFAVNRFRPVQKRSTDTGMAILRKVADDASSPAEFGASR
jgi:hypothetical protein